MAKQNKSLAFKALDTFAKSRVDLIRDMKAAGYHTIEDAETVVIEWAAAKTGAEFRIATSTGRALLVSSHPKYEAAKSVKKDIMAMLEGTTRHAKAKASRNAKTEPVKVPAHVLKLAKALAEAAGDRSLANTALALAFAK